MNLTKNYLQGWRDLEKISDNWKVPLSYSALEQYGNLYSGGKLAEKLGEPRQCYSNSFKAMIEDNHIYCEGLCVPSGGMPLPIFHAWTLRVRDTLSDEVIVEVVEHTLKEPAIEYFGVPMNRDFVCKFAVSVGYYGIWDNLYLAYKQGKLVNQIENGEFVHKQY
jgi:hypothetical protein